jgi:hypothetical protein
MADMAHYPTGNNGAAKFIGGAILVLLALACLGAAYAVNLADAALTAAR